MENPISHTTKKVFNLYVTLEIIITFLRIRSDGGFSIKNLFYNNENFLIFLRK